MPIFYMETNAVRAIAVQIKQISEEIREQAQILNAAVQNVGWVGHNRDEFVANSETLAQQIAMQTETGVTLAGKIEAEIVEWEQIANNFSSTNESSQGGSNSSPTGYINAENQNSISEQRKQDVINILEETDAGKEILNYLRENNIEIIFGELPPERIGNYKDGKIVLSTDFANLSDYELAATLYHEAMHAKSNPSALEALNPNHLIEEEYNAFVAQADFWKEIKNKHNLPNNNNLDSLVEGIYDKEKACRAINDAYYLNQNLFFHWIYVRTFLKTD